MDEKVHQYENDEIEVRYDLNRCIHARECVKGLPAVFNPDQRPWIQPDAADAGRVAEIVEQCPTGALQYRRKDKGSTEEAPPKNTIAVVPDGPVYFRGSLEIRDHEGSVIHEDRRFALCRCGDSKNKPACDNSHVDSAFEAPAAINRASLQGDSEPGQPDKLVLKLMKNGPILVEGTYEIYSDTSQPVKGSKNIALCRCGASSSKPFCDGSHKEIGFDSSR